MKNWVRKKIAEISTVFEDGDWIESKDQSSDGIRLIQTGNVGNGIFKDRGEKARYISEATFKRLRCTEIFEGDCLVSRLPDPVGRACILPDTGEKMITAVDCTIIRFDNKQIIPSWFLYYSLSNEYQNEIQKQVTGATRQRISRKNLGLVSVPVAPLPEQQRIVSILDECFAAIDKAKANAEQNLKNAKELFESYLQGVFEKKGDGWEEKIIKDVCELKSGTTISTNLERTTGDVLYVKVSDMNLLENEVEINTSSRFVKSNEIKANQIIPNGAIIFPKRGGAIATNKKRKIVKPTIVDLNTMAIIPSSKIDADYFFHWFQLIDLNSISNGTSIPQINNYSFDEVKIPFPKSKTKQQTIVRQLDALRAETQKLEAVYQKKIDDLEELKKSVLQKAFAGELSSSVSTNLSSAKVIPLQKVEGISPTDLQAGITAIALRGHSELNKQDAFGHVKAEKIIHLAEYILNIDLERNPVKDAAGPNDFPHAKKVESRAAKAGFYTVAKRITDQETGYIYTQGRSIDSLINKTQNCLEAKNEILATLLKLIVPMKTQQAEIVATVYAAWNNLIIQGAKFTDENIVTEARENWREEKLKIPSEKFFKAIEWMRKNELLIPKGNGKIVLPKKN